MMNIHRLTTQNLPSIRVHDHQSLFESSYDDTPSGHAQRSLPRDIPFKHSSPTAIRGSHNRSDVPPPLPLLPMNWDSAGTSARERPGHPISPLWGSPSSGRGFVGSHESSRGTSFKRHEDGLERETRNGLSKLHIHERYCR